MITKEKREIDFIISNSPFDTRTASDYSDWTFEASDHQPLTAIFKILDTPEAERTVVDKKFSTSYKKTVEKMLPSSLDCAM